MPIVSKEGRRDGRMFGTKVTYNDLICSFWALVSSEIIKLISGD
jgi:hypothetical protein